MPKDKSDWTDLSLSGIDSLLEGIQTRLPYLSDEERDMLANTLLDEVGKRIANGEDLAFVKPTRDGQVKLTHLDLDRIRRRLR
jgi:antirestriction protein ArdC